MPFEIQTITAFVGVDEEGSEGLVGFFDPELRTWVPLVCADEKRVESMYKLAVQVMEPLNKPFRVLQFSTRADISEETKAKYGKDTAKSRRLVGVPTC
jgi:hypothetical protein